MEENMMQGGRDRKSIPVGFDANESTFGAKTMSQAESISHSALIKWFKKVNSPTKIVD
jgi:hypothetical protein